MYALIMALEAVDGVLTNKRKADELSRIAAKKRKTKCQKQSRTRNTTRSDNGGQRYSEDKEENEKEIKADKDLLSEWYKIMQKQQLAVAAARVEPLDP